VIVPSIDLMGGQAVQLVGGERLALEAGDPFPIAEKFARVGVIAVVDLDAALGRGDNTALVRELCARHRVRVGGGLRSVAAVRAMLDAGAESVVVGSAASPAFMQELGADVARTRVFAALDAKDGEIVTHGWTRRTGRRVEDGLRELAGLVRGFLVTTVEREGRLGGCDVDSARRWRAAAGAANAATEFTLAGGVTTAEEVAELDRLAIDAQVGMALYTGRLGLGAAFGAPLVSDRADGLVPTIVCDESERALGLVWSNAESIALSVESGRAHFVSRRRGLWEKGATSGDRLDVIRFEADCDRDALRLVARPRREDGALPCFCHLGTATCFGAAHGVARLERTLMERRRTAPVDSYSARLFGDRELLASKLVEEARELGAESGRARVVEEAADVLYFALAKLASVGASLADVETELERRSARVTRRPGEAKPSLETATDTEVVR
jgi:phosphoribosyl-ATP pyrophosphohydrolase